MKNKEKYTCGKTKNEIIVIVATLVKKRVRQKLMS